MALPKSLPGCNALWAAFKKPAPIQNLIHHDGRRANTETIHHGDPSSRHPSTLKIQARTTPSNKVSFLFGVAAPIFDKMALFRFKIAEPASLRRSLDDADGRDLGRAGRRERRYDRIVSTKTIQTDRIDRTAQAAVRSARSGLAVSNWLGGPGRGGRSLARQRRRGHGDSIEAFRSKRFDWIASIGSLPFGRRKGALSGRGGRTIRLKRFDRSNSIETIQPDPRAAEETKESGGHQRSRRKEGRFGRNNPIEEI